MENPRVVWHSWTILIVVCLVYVIAHAAGQSQPCNAPRYCDDGEQYGDPEDCHSYYLCANVIYEHKSCGVSCYDIRSKGCLDCNDPANIPICEPPCPPGALPTPPTVTGPCEEHIEICAENENATDKYFPDDYYCERRYFCRAQILEVAPDCASGTVFHFINQSCVTKTPDVDCEHPCPTILTTTVTEITTTITDIISTTPPGSASQTFHCGVLFIAIMSTVMQIVLGLIIV